MTAPNTAPNMMESATAASKVDRQLFHGSEEDVSDPAATA